MTETRLADQDARDAIRSSFDETLIVEAAAGTGKTTALVGRIVALVSTGKARLSQIVSVTFTEKAAGEMKLRLRTAIEAARAEASGEEATRLDEGLLELEAARIGTIHSLCTDLLRERPIEARIDPMFQVSSDPASKQRFNRIFESWFRDSLSNPGPGLRRVLRKSPDRSVESPYFSLRRAGWDITEHRDFGGKWSSFSFEREARIDALIEGMRELAPLADQAFKDRNPLTRSFAAMAQALERIDRTERVHERDYDGLEVEFRGYLSGPDRWWALGDRGWGDFYGPRLPTPEVQARRDQWASDLRSLVADCEAELAPLLHQELLPVVARYTAAKQQEGALDFVDLLQCTRDLLVSSSEVRAELQGRFSHILVDEFQDTDPLQVDIVLLLASDDSSVSDPALVRPIAGKLFVVGDPKQSIYRFRRADIAIYKAVKAQLKASGARELHLSVSFRSDPRIQDLVNGAFSLAMQGGSQADYVPLRPYRDAVSGRPAAIALGIPEPYTEWGQVRKTAVRRSVPKAVGAFLDFLLTESGWTVTDPLSGELVPIRARHVCLLFRSLRGFKESKTTEFVRELEVRDIPHVLVGGSSFHDREEVLCMRNALAAIERPEDQLSVFATLRGPLFALGDDALLAWREEVGTLNPLRSFEEDQPKGILTEVAAALEVLRDLHYQRNSRRFSQTVGDLLERTRAHAGFAIWNAGEQVLANVLRFTHLAREAEEAGTPSFRAFVESLEGAARRGVDVQATFLEEGTEGVRMMTVHRSKGLEFPVVIVCDPAQNKTFSTPSRWIDAEAGCWYQPLAGCRPRELQEAASEVLARDEEESDRLLYVATTRARDLLVVPAVADEVLEGWLQPLKPAIYPTWPERLNSTPPPGCPPLGLDTVPSRPAKAKSPDRGVRPGCHVSQTGGEIVWWGPGGLPISKRKPHGLRHQQLLVEDDSGVSSARGTAEHERWREARIQGHRLGKSGALRVRTATAVARGSGDEELPPTPPVLETSASLQPDRPRGIRFGSLVHGVLERIPFDPDIKIEPYVLQQSVLLGASESERVAAIEAVRSALEHPLLRRAAASPDCRREAPFAHSPVEGEFLEGTIDLVFSEDRDGEVRWVVVEFKTSLGDEESARRYGLQLQTYVDAVVAATRAEVEGTLLIV